MKYKFYFPVIETNNARRKSEQSIHVFITLVAGLNAAALITAISNYA